MSNLRLPHVFFLDIDECAAGTHNCSVSEGCFNTQGGFRCLSFICPPNYRHIAKGWELIIRSWWNKTIDCPQLRGMHLTCPQFSGHLFLFLIWLIVMWIVYPNPAVDIRRGFWPSFIVQHHSFSLSFPSFSTHVTVSNIHPMSISFFPFQPLWARSLRVRAGSCVVFLSAAENLLLQHQLPRQHSCPCWCFPDGSL